MKIKNNDNIKLESQIKEEIKRLNNQIDKQLWKSNLNNIANYYKTVLSTIYCNAVLKIKNRRSSQIYQESQKNYDNYYK